MTAHPEINGGSDPDRLHRDEITVTMNWVIRTCQGRRCGPTRSGPPVTEAAKNQGKKE
ncbi:MULTISPECIES: hypothetical protein [Streptomyces violaceusniger group]|uniref:Transposase n=2 Tax=Streptomyces javensis TaxID=114698 RepID=A0ABN1WY62_9ACTN|nr:hypothetical protein [Streptomyces javensis]MBI0315702.1 hypothetical protein [Streptomyces javensis]